MDTKLQSATRGRLLAAVITAGLTAYLTSKGLALSDEDRTAIEMLVLAGFSGLASVIALFSKLREGKQ